MAATGTKPLYYQDDGSLHHTTTQIISCQSISQLNDDERRLAKNISPESFAIITKETVFYPQGGGQPSDTGEITLTTSPSDNTPDDTPIFTVLLVRKTPDGTILHFGTFNPSTGTPQPPFPDSHLVSQTINRTKRNYHSRLHTAGHIIGLAMRLLIPVLGERKKVKANHAPGEACMEFEGLLYNEHKPVIEAKVNELVAQELPVQIDWWDEGDVQRASLNMVEGLQLGRNGRVRVARIGEVDANPCGGTHVKHTGLTGRISIRKIARVKGVSKLSYEVPVDFFFIFGGSR